MFAAHGSYTPIPKTAQANGNATNNPNRMTEALLSQYGKHGTIAIVTPMDAAAAPSRPVESSGPACASRATASLHAAPSPMRSHRAKQKKNKRLITGTKKSTPATAVSQHPQPLHGKRHTQPDKWKRHTRSVVANIRVSGMNGI